VRASLLARRSPRRHFAGVNRESLGGEAHRIGALASRKYNRGPAVTELRAAVAGLRRSSRRPDAETGLFDVFSCTQFNSCLP
jgi:hypothetical protein